MHNFPRLVFGAYILVNEVIDFRLQLNIKLLLQCLHVLIAYRDSSTGTTSRCGIGIIDRDIDGGVRRIGLLNHVQATLLGNHGDAAGEDIAGCASFYCLHRRNVSGAA